MSQSTATFYTSGPGQYLSVEFRKDSSGDARSDTEREQQAKLAGHVIYSSVHSDGSTSMPPPLAASDRHPAIVVTSPEPPRPMDNTNYYLGDGRMSSVRRTFCLLVLFDLILMFILWVIYTQLIGDTGYTAFEKQVKNYNFKTSLFDSVMLSAIRFTFLLLGYGLFKLRHWWVIALCTAFTCATLIAKIFLFDFEGMKSSNNPLSYCLIIISFVLAWAETWFLDFKVIPQEQKALDKLLQYSRGVTYGSTYGSSRPLLMGQDDMQSVITEDNQFYSPVESPEGSDTEEATIAPRPSTNRTSEYQSVATSKTHTRQENDYIRLARHSWDVLWTYVTSPESDWKCETGVNESSGVVHSKKVKGVGKVFRLKGIVDMPVKDLYEEMTFKPEEQATWNKAIKECRILQVVDDHTDILYNIAAEIAGGVITSRDFVSLRTWGSRDDIFIGAGMGVNHPEMPPQKSYVRGTNGVGGWVYKPMPGNANKTLFFWYMNTDIKGWFPQSLIDANMAKVLMDFLHDLRTHVKSITNS
ncbi:stAR-related lipid transfer protein 3-like isoform X2 [Physella acuta]|uniref:stAR-related lipid transfer protein 3-like isoform X2 n=1 Tax=Physella acuta TaxID=109671 RepID=UPI0027DB2CAD|nr:stAR-related lipid transfer protein 3-like isoform X2 [Physella acuta]